MSWVTTCSSYYHTHCDGWEVAQDHLSGEAGTDKREHYLHRKKQGESKEAFKVRYRMADYTPHYMRAVISLAGMLFQKEEEAERTWSKVLGTPGEEDSDMAALYKDADGAGTAWPTLLKATTVDLIAKREVWVLVEGVTRDSDGTPINAGSVTIVQPEDVQDVIVEDGRPVQVQMASRRDERTSVKDEEEFREESYVYTLDGYERWQEGESKEAQQITEGTQPYGRGGFAYYATPARRKRVLPIFKVEVPVRANVGHLMALKAGAIFNMESARDFHLWAACFARLVVETDSEDVSFDDRWEKTLDLMKKGSSLIPGPADYIAPPMDGATVRNATIERKVEEFYQTFFQSYGDAARERTATEIQQDARSGVAAYLGLLAGALDEIEAGILWRLDQVNAADNPSAWGAGSVNRTNDFTPVDAQEAVKGLVERWVGTDRSLPLTEGVASEVLQKVAERDGLSLEAEDAELLAEALAKRSRAGTERQEAEAARAQQALAADAQYAAERGGIRARLERSQTGGEEEAEQEALEKAEVSD